MATKTFSDEASLQAALVALTPTQRATVSASPATAGGFVLTYPDAIATTIGADLVASQLIAYAKAKQAPVLAALQVTHALKDGSATLTTMCDPGSMIFLNSLAAWSIMTASSATRAYYNLDGSSHEVAPAEMGEFLTTVGAVVQSTFDALATIISGITASPPTIKTYADIDAASWPTTAG